MIIFQLYIAKQYLYQVKNNQLSIQGDDLGNKRIYFIIQCLDHTNKNYLFTNLFIGGPHPLIETQEAKISIMYGFLISGLFVWYGFGWATYIYIFPLYMFGDQHLQAHTSLIMWEILILVRNFVIGTISVGLVIGGCLFTHFLFRLSRLPKQCRQYREMKYHLESQTFLRYVITIICIFTVNILFYSFFDLGRACAPLGAVFWIIYGIYGWGRDTLKKIGK